MRRYVRVALWLSGVTAFSLIVAFVISMRAPDVTQMRKCMRTSMFNVELCPSSSSYTRLQDVSDVFLNALVVSEDASFFSHKGIDAHEIRESIRRNLKSGGFVRGGSTITQQLVKNVFLDQEKSLVRKARELYITFKVEEEFSKNEILERYINVVEFGPGVYGVKQAARHYFSKHPSALNVLEAVYLVHLLPSPKVYSRTFLDHQLTEFSRERILTLVDRLARFKRISAETVEWARAHIDAFPWTGISMDYEAEVIEDDTESAIDTETDW